MNALYAAVVAFLCGSIPFSQFAARIRAGVDLRTVDTGTVSGTNLYRVTGFGTLAVVGVGEVAKGSVGPLVAGDRPVLAAVCAGLAVTGHNWSPFLRGAGGRGISPAIGALLVVAWPGAAVLVTGLAFGRLARATSLGCFVADIALVPIVWVTNGAYGAISGTCVVIPMLVKRLVGNARPRDPGARGHMHRLLFDNDPVPRA